MLAVRPDTRLNLAERLLGPLARMASGLIAVAVLTGCTCGDLRVTVYSTGSGEQFRGWSVGDTASVFAEAGYVNSTPDMVCPRYGSRAAPNYRGQVEPDSFTFQSSRPEVASVTNHGLVTGLQVGQTDITATSAGVVSRPLTIAVQAAQAVRAAARPLEAARVE